MQSTAAMIWNWTSDYIWICYDIKCYALRRVCVRVGVGVSMKEHVGVGVNMCVYMWVLCVSV